MISRSAVAGYLISWLPALAWAGFIFFLSAQPSSSFEQLGISGDLISAAGHLILYGVLAALLIWALRRCGITPGPRLWLLVLVFAGLYAFTDEFHQSFVPGRTATGLDWLIDMIGALVAIVIVARYNNGRNPPP